MARNEKDLINQWCAHNGYPPPQNEKYLAEIKKKMGLTGGLTGGLTVGFTGCFTGGAAGKKSPQKSHDVMSDDIIKVKKVPAKKSWRAKKN